MPDSNSMLAANMNAVQLALPEWLYGPTAKVPITSLPAYNNDPHKYPEQQILGLMLGIRMTGYIPPLSITSVGTMLMGGPWVEAAKRLGVTEVPVVVVDLKLAIIVYQFDHRRRDNRWCRRNGRSAVDRPIGSSSTSAFAQAARPQEMASFTTRRVFRRPQCTLSLATIIAQFEPKRLRYFYFAWGRTGKNNPDSLQPPPP